MEDDDEDDMEWVQLWTDLLGPEWVRLMQSKNRFAGASHLKSLRASVQAGESFIQRRDDVWVLQTRVSFCRDDAKVFRQIGLQPAEPDGTPAPKRKADEDGWYYYIAAGTPPTDRQETKSALRM
jgi:hypothetical protein